MVQTAPISQSPTFVKSIAIPPLENGDQLSRQEFERRSSKVQGLREAELIEGIVYMSAALRFSSHGKPHSQLNVWLGTYQAYTPGVSLGDAPTVRLDDINEPQPDIVMILDETHGGQTVISKDDYIEGSPELVAEISASTVSIDMGAKRNAYERNGIQEYIVWRVLDEELDWFVLENGKYVNLLPDPNGILQSQVFPGLWLDRSALLQGNMPQVLAIVHHGIQSDPHQQFCNVLPQV